MLTFLLLGLAQAPAPPSDSVRLSEALAFARAHRGSVVSARAALDEARAGASEAKALPNPTATMTWDQSAPRRSVGVQQSFEWLLRRPGELGAAHARVDRSRSDLSGAERDLDREVRRAFFGAIAAGRVRELAAAQAIVADSLERIAARRLAAGDIPDAEHDRLQLERVLAQQALSHARADEGSAVLALARMMGWPDATPLAPLAGAMTDELDAATASTPNVDLIPTVRAALADSAAADAMAGSLSLGRIPLPTLEVTRQWDDPAEPGRTLWLVGASIPVPLFDRGGARVSGARARLRQATATLLEVRLDAREAVASAALQLREARTRAHLASDSLLPGAARLRARAARAYALGETGILPLLEALRTEREVVATALTDLLAFQDALATWYSLTGTTE
ncbi:MAG: TolC family protein [Gemmatimonadales bacterium]